jgi:hypothetical protein
MRLSPAFDLIDDQLRHEAQDRGSYPHLALLPSNQLTAVYLVSLYMCLFRNLGPTIGRTQFSVLQVVNSELMIQQL